jgi:hypothetical protein
MRTKQKGNLFGHPWAQGLDLVFQHPVSHMVLLDVMLNEVLKEQ